MDELIKEVRSLGEQLSDADAVKHDFNLKPYFTNLTVVAGPKKGPLLSVEGKSIVVNSGHAMAKKLADGKPGRAQVLVAAIISLVNRAEEKLTDNHQRQLHSHLLLSMVG